MVNQRQRMSQLKANILKSQDCPFLNWSGTAWASASTFRGTDFAVVLMAHVFALAPRKDGQLNQPAGGKSTGRNPKNFSKAQSGDKKNIACRPDCARPVSAAIEEAAKKLVLI